MALCAHGGEVRREGTLCGLGPPYLASFMPFTYPQRPCPCPILQMGKLRPGAVMPKVRPLGW